MSKRVAILGGGIAGMSAAHALIRRGFDVSVFEAASQAGGKARSFPLLGTGVGLREDLPAEHGFRFFPGFYRHLIDTMREIDVGGGLVASDRLVDTDCTLLARGSGQPNILSPNKFPTSLGSLIQAFEAFSIFYCDMGIPKREVMHFIRCLIAMMVSCDQRRFYQWETMSWQDYIGVGTEATSAEYELYLARGLSRSLVALNASDLSSRTGACILLQFLLCFVGNVVLDRVLDLPTSEAWLDPWLQQLRAQGVEFHLNAPVEAIECSDGRISGIQVYLDGRLQRVTADYYIAAFPVEVMQAKLTAEMEALAPSLASIRYLRTSWMTGILFYLKRDVTVVRGHANYLDSPWALTSISQAQFWPSKDLQQCGDGQVQGILSVIISNWEDPLCGSGPRACDCTEDEVKEHVWEQLKQHLNRVAAIELRDEDVVCSRIAPCMVCRPGSPPAWTNSEPLFINTVGSWQQRPEAVTEIPNLFLASDYVRTHTDLATMESANEAARRAVNGILDCEASAQPRCDVWPLREPSLLNGYKVLDGVRYQLGKPPLVPPLPPLLWPCL